MILKRVEQADGVIEALYESSNIIASKYETSNNRLTLVFKKSGQEYIYENVPTTDYNKLELADSQGVAFAKYLRSYPFTKGEKVDIQSIYERIEAVRQEEIDGFTRPIIELCKFIHLEFERSGNLAEQELYNLVGLVDARRLKIEKK